jgi:histidine triad (HIT) family protein
METKDCLFCKIVSGEVPSSEVYEDDNFIGILDINPLAEGHTLIIPKKHFRNLLDLPATLGNELLEAIKKISLNLIQDGKAEGVNVQSSNEKAAQQEVLHTHVHIIPRKENDNIKIN